MRRNGYLSKSRFNDIGSLLNIAYPLVNNTGHFTYSGFLYAYINSVIIYGIPSSMSGADDEDYCPVDFVEHDMGHMSRMTDFMNINDYGKRYNHHKGPELYDETSPIYHLDIISNMFYEILSLNIDVRQKELMIFVIWSEVHEGNRMLILYKDIDTIMSIVSGIDVSVFLDASRYQDYFLEIAEMYNIDKDGYRDITKGVLRYSYELLLKLESVKSVNLNVPLP